MCERNSLLSSHQRSGDRKRVDCPKVSPCETSFRQQSNLVDPEDSKNVGVKWGLVENCSFGDAIWMSPLQKFGLSTTIPLYLIDSSIVCPKCFNHT
ncbi:hypothetical protein TNCV_5112271 [Trichonephila clavipes]|nr:hypothetical protein TNCV_5112271 [Trichonephila clavipes]